MNTQELVAALEDAGINSWWYAIYCEPPLPGPFPYAGGLGEAATYLRREPNGRWEQGYCERGVYKPKRLFDSEDEACRATLSDLVAYRERRSRRVGS
jgi:hypothetical protein